MKMLFIFLLLAHQCRPDVGADPFQQLHGFEGKAVFAAVIKMNEANNFIFIANGY